MTNIDVFNASMHDLQLVCQIKSRYRALALLMDERMRRQWAATEAQTYGRGGLSAVSDATGICNTIRKGMVETAERRRKPKSAVSKRLRRAGGGCKRLSAKNPGLIAALEGLVGPTSRGDPMSAIRWTCKSTTNLSEELTRLGHPISPWTVGAMLKAAGYRLKGNRKTKEGGAHPDRNAQFEFINQRVQQFQHTSDSGNNPKHRMSPQQRSSDGHSPCGLPPDRSCPAAPP